MPPPGPAPIHTIIADPGEGVEIAAARFALAGAEASERMLSELTQIAITEWRLQDATFWQRVKFRSRMMRAVHFRQGQETWMPREDSNLN